MASETNYYKKLGISPNASQEEIRKAYRKTLLKVHPDLNTEEGATELFLNIQEAYSILSNPSAKASYDSQQKPEKQPVEKNLFNIQPLYSYDALQYLDEPQLIYTLVDIVAIAPPPPNQERLPLNLVLILDISTSMKGKRLDTLKAATMDIIQELDSRDLISIVAFNDRAKIILRPQHPPKFSDFQPKIMSLTAKGGTEIYQGLETGYKQIYKNLKTDRVNHIFLITDGHTYGDDKDCLRLAKQAANLDIGISGLGIGSDWNDEFIDKIASLTGGNSIYIQKPQQIKDFLKQQVRHLTKIYAKNVLLDLTTAPKVNLITTFRLLPDVGSLRNKSPLSLGVLRYKTRIRILLEFLVDPLPKEVDEVILATGEFTFKLRDKKYNRPITLKRSVVTSDIKSSPPQGILQAISHLTMYRMQAQAQLDIARGDHNKASKRMSDLATQLLAKDQVHLGKTALEESSHIKKHHSFSPDGQKRIKYGTRKLLLPIN